MRPITLALLLVALFLPAAPPTVSAQDDAAQLSVTLTSAPANLDMPETYRLRFSADSSGPGFISIGPVTGTLPPGTVFNGSTPAADCQPDCIKTTPATVTWTNPCSTPLVPGGNCDIQVTVTFPSATFPSGTEVTNSFTAQATPVGGSQQSYGPASLTHPVTTFVPSPDATVTKSIVGNSPNPPTLNQTFSYELNVSNSGNVTLENLVVIDTLPVEFTPSSVTTGAYSGLGDFAVGVGVRVSYEKNTAPGVFTLWGSSPNTSTNTTLTSPPPGLGAGEYITLVRWQFGPALPGMAATARPRLTGQIINPDNAGGPVAIGDTIQNCAGLTAVYAGGPTGVSDSDCASFTLSGPFVQLNPAIELPSAGPFRPGETISWRLRVRSDARSSDPLPLEHLETAWLLPAELDLGSWTFDDRGTGLPAPQSLEQIPDFAGSGRTLLRWRWNTGSGLLGTNQEIRINVSTPISAAAGPSTVSAELAMEHDAPGLSLRCTGSSRADSLDLDEDGDSAEAICSAGASFQITVPDLELALTDGGLSAAPGGLVVYVLSYLNSGARAASGVELRAEVPEGASFEADLSAPGWSCADGSPAGTLCTLAVGALGASADGTAAFVVRASNPAPAGLTQLSLAAQIADDGAGGLDPSPDNNAAAETTPLITALSLALAKGVTPAVALPGQPVTYTLSFTASGDIVAAGVWISDTIPAELTDVTFSSSLPVSENGTRPALRWEVGELAPGASQVITVSGVVDPGLAADTTIANRAEIGGLRGTTPVSAEGAVDFDVRLPRVSLAAASITVDETAGEATVTVELDRPNPYRAISVSYAASGGTARPGDDYEPAAGVISFPAGSASQTIRVPIIDDLDDEPDELLEISLSAPDGAVLGATTTLSLRIVDNDEPPLFLPLVLGAR